MKNKPRQIFLFTTTALLAFAANSVLCRLALGDGVIDAVSFTVIRILSGAGVLWLLLVVQARPSRAAGAGSWFAATMLFVYAITFSLAYTKVETGVGALVLFSSVQITMLIASVQAGERIKLLGRAGLGCAFAGLVYLMWPNSDLSKTSPSYVGFALMALSGVAWGAYSLAGKGSVSPLADTAYNFLRAAPLCLLSLVLFVFQAPLLSFEGVLLATVAGAITSGLGYAIWYLALPGLSRFQSAGLQLSVPVLAAAGGVLVVGEPLTLKLVLSLIVILVGIAMIIYSPDK